MKNNHYENTVHSNAQTSAPRSHDIHEHKPAFEPVPPFTGQTSKRNQKKCPRINFSALAAALLITAGMFLPNRSGKEAPHFSPASHVATALPGMGSGLDSVHKSNEGSRILMEHPAVFSEGDSGFYVPEENYAFRTDVLREDVISITFLDTTENAPADAVDASLDCDGSVLAWTKANFKGHDLYIAAEGGVIAPEVCTEMFAYFTGLERIDLSCLDTGMVYSMSWMFQDCHKLTSLDLSMLDSSNVEYMAYAFWSCTALEEIDLTGLDTSKFSQIDCMLYETPCLKNINGDFELGNVSTFSNFMDEGDTVNGRPWEELFR